jgi:hypothetical protein
LQEALESTDDAEKRADILCRKLRRWLKHNPLQHFCFVDEWLSTCKDHILDEGYLARLLFWIMMDYRLSWLRCDCPRCDPQTGVPVARLWLQIPDYREHRKCRVLLVNDWQPFRRPIQPDVCLPARSDCINIGRFLWQRKEEIEGKYAASFHKVKIPSSVNRFSTWLEGEMEADLCRQPSPDDPLQLYVVTTPEFQEQRVVGFTSF